MKFGPAEMVQMMGGAKALITVTMVSSVGIGLVLGVIVALFVVFFRGRLHRDRAEPHLTNGQLLPPNSGPGPNAVYPGSPLRIGNDMIADYRIARSDDRIFPIRLIILLLIVAVGGGVLYWQYASQRSDSPQRPDLPLRAAYTEVYSMLGISPLPEAVESSAIRRPLEQLSRERCDRQAIFDLARALQNAGYRREAAKVDVSFSGMCGGYAPSLRRAANILLELIIVELRQWHRT
jgi:hypothetical protein